MMNVGGWLDSLVFGMMVAGLIGLLLSPAFIFLGGMFAYYGRWDGVALCAVPVVWSLCAGRYVEWQNDRMKVADAERAWRRAGY